jgi:uncharacterized protein (DUF1800 family)
MHITRRQFIIGGTAGLGALSSPALLSLIAPDAQAAREAPESIDYGQGFSILSRISFGATPQDYQELSQLGLSRYLDKQLHPVDAEDRYCNARLASATLHIEYKASEKVPEDKKVAAALASAAQGKTQSKIPDNDYPAVNEDRPLRTLNMPIEELWKLSDGSVRMDGKERNRPVQEVRAATWIRAVYSQWQLREVMAEFWHNHFNVNATSQQQISATFPIYDAIMRRNCFGNFRTFLEEVAKSTAMQFYLNNAKSKASPANENYARELFELHTLGADHYYNNLYNRWREVPGAVHGHPIGYIDQDVYEAARAFTGWTIEDGSNTGRGTIFPKTGKFVYFDGWHDNYQKRVLGNEFDPNTPPMNDGRKVLDLVSAHPGTAMFLCTKLCRRFVADEPPQSLVKGAAKVWMQSVKKPDQIARVLRFIILSKEFRESGGRKVKRPFDYMTAFLRATGAEVTPNENLFNNVTGAGYRQFEWAAPTGHPDVAEYWLNTNTTLSCWNLLAALVSGGGKMAVFDLARQTPAQIQTSGDIVSYWTMRLIGRQPDSELFTALMQFMPRPNDPHFVPNLQDPRLKDPLQQMVMTIAMLPDFQMRG